MSRMGWAHKAPVASKPSPVNMIPREPSCEATGRDGCPRHSAARLRGGSTAEVISMRRTSQQFIARLIIEARKSVQCSTLAIPVYEPVHQDGDGREPFDRLAPVPRHPNRTVPRVLRRLFVSSRSICFVRQSSAPCWGAPADSRDSCCSLILVQSITAQGREKYYRGV